ncbi:MAG: hypothetical protein JO318_18615, partial [Chloroflexi bacterium]|nr:hypothetical protein [Chloroflexota bacterium]
MLDGAIQSADSRAMELAQLALLLAQATLRVCDAPAQFLTRDVGGCLKQLQPSSGWEIRRGFWTDLQRSRQTECALVAENRLQRIRDAGRVTGKERDGEVAVQLGFGRRHKRGPTLAKAQHHHLHSRRRREVGTPKAVKERCFEPREQQHRWQGRTRLADK